jgi:osmotically-inducible protein OsmY
MKKNDKDLQRDVVEELRFDPSISDEELAVSAKDGVVTLVGSVSTFAQKLAAERAVERVAGVKAFADDIEVKLDGRFERSDTEIAHAVLETLKWDVEVPDDAITARVENRWVMLEGTVDWPYEKDSAERAVRNLAGVRGVTNLIDIKPRVSALDVKVLIEDALRRSAEIDAKEIGVEVENGIVKLRGKVRSFAERRDAQLAAWSAPGVTRVEDELEVTLTP